MPNIFDLDEGSTQKTTDTNKILIDANGTIFSAVYVDLKHKDDMNENMIRHYMLNMFRSYIKKFKKENQEIIICVDNTYNEPNWRLKTFKYYKAGRKKAREASNIDWVEFFRIFSTIIEELKTNFPYKVISVPSAEADDVIGVLCTNKNPDTEYVVISNDKDMCQLTRFKGVKVYSPQKKMLSKHNPFKHLMVLVLKGDAGDGVPNIYSPDDQFVKAVKKKQKAISEKDIESWYDKTFEHIANGNETVLNNLNRNSLMVDLSKTPENVKQLILDEAQKPAIGSSKNLYGYFFKKRLSGLLDNIGDFI